MAWVKLYQALDTPLRWGNAGLWALIIIIATPCLWSVVRRRAGLFDYLWVVGGLIGVGLSIFQYRSLAGIVPSRPDGYSTSALSSLLISAILILLMRVRSAPEEHRRAALLTHVGFLVICAVAGVISGIPS